MSFCHHETLRQPRLPLRAPWGGTASFPVPGETVRCQPIPGAPPRARSPLRFAWPGGSPGTAARPCLGGSGRCPASPPAPPSAPAGRTQAKSKPGLRGAACAPSTCPADKARSRGRSATETPADPGETSTAQGSTTAGSHHDASRAPNARGRCNTDAGNLPGDPSSSRQRNCGKMAIYLYCFKEESIFLFISGFFLPLLVKDAFSSK